MANTTHSKHFAKVKKYYTRESGTRPASTTP